MKPRATIDLLARLTEITQENICQVEALALLSSEALHQRPRPGAWNALECLAHLNHYGDYYLPEIRQQISGTKYPGAQPTFTSSWLGNKFAAGMKPGPEMRKINTFKSANPVNFKAPLNHATLKEFLRQQQETLELLKRSATVDLTKTKTGTSLSRLIKLRLGDTLRTIIYHNWRHVLQAARAADLS